MKLSKFSVLCVAFMSVPLTSCGGQKEEDNTVDVFVLSGQSNMEGSTYYDNGNDWLRKAFTRLELDITPFEDEEGKVSKNAPGIENVLTSYYGFYPHNPGTPTPRASNKSNPIQGQFLPTNVAMGNQEHYMGPEIGLSYVLQDYASSNRPIYLIKCAFSGSGFKPNTNNNKGYNWVTDKTDSNYDESNNLYENHFYPFVNNNLRLIEETGKTPVIKGFLWHQGETDAGNSDYYTQMKGLVSRFRSDFADYAYDGDGESISFIDAYIYDGPNSPYTNPRQDTPKDLAINGLKERLAKDSDNNYVINTSYAHEDGQEKLELAINPNAGDVEGGDNMYHYKTYDCVRLGMAYANMIIDNGLLG